MFEKYASAEIIEVKSAHSKQRVATLDKFADWSDHNYRTDDDYLYVRVRAISSRVNLNHDSWPSEELAKSYSSFVGKPLFVEHNNGDPRRTRGVIVDAKLHRDDEKTASLDPYYASDECWDCHKPPTWVELLLEVDAKTYPKFASAIIKGDIDGFSMGANVERSVCSHCANEATSPEEFCSHILAKGAYFDYEDPNTGRKTSRRAAEHCYDFHFFELSGVVQPADETALTVPGTLKHASAEKVADHNDPPRYEAETAPTKVDTLRQERMCPVCGTPGMEDGSCRVCQYVEPPEGFGNPDLERAQEVDQKMRERNGPVDVADDEDELGQFAPTSSALKSEEASNQGAVVANTGGPRGRVRVEETPALPAARRASDKPKDAKVVEDHKKPVESSAREGTSTNMSDTHKTADGASAHGGADTAPDKRVDPEGVGAVLDNPLEGVEHQDLAKDVNVTGDPTSTWSGTDGQTDPVTGESFPAAADGVTASEHTAGPAFPDHEPTKVDLGADIAEEVGARTETWSGTEGQADPITKEVGDLIDVHKAAARKHTVACFRLAETEIELGITPAQDKYNRISELEGATQEELDAQLSTLARVRTAGLRKQAAKKTTASSIPSLQGPRVASINPTEHAVPASDDDIADAQAFM